MPLKIFFSCSLGGGGGGGGGRYFSVPRRGVLVFVSFLSDRNVFSTNVLQICEVRNVVRGGGNRALVIVF